MKLNSLALGALTLAALATVARAQSGGPFELSRSAIHGGGGTSVGNGSTGDAGAETPANSQASRQFTLTGTIGQPDAGIAKLKGGQFSLAGGFWSYLSVVQTPGTPLLKIKLVGANAVLSWPLNTSGFLLQETPSLNAPVWTSTPQSIVDTATEHTVIIPANGLMKSFRLKHP